AYTVKEFADISNELLDQFTSSHKKNTGSDKTVQTQTEQKRKSVSFETKETASETETETVTELSTETQTDPPQSTPETSASLEGIRPEFKQMMDEYEAFFDQYCDFMNKYAENPSDTSMIMEYANFMTQYVDTMESFEAVESSDLSNEELKYYIEVTARIETKLLDAATYTS
ncbi:MAG: hypothetical protein Q4B26_19910, partial [Eubacteriales bacterium]|nr:hypothetical protein [Eubacteriales bacterium]